MRHLYSDSMKLILTNPLTLNPIAPEHADHYLAVLKANAVSNKTTETEAGIVITISDQKINLFEDSMDDVLDVFDENLSYALVLEYTGTMTYYLANADAS